MEDSETVEETQAPGAGAGARLRAAREAAGLDLAQVASETRIPQRHLEAIEAGDFASLPSRTYAVGFSRTYAKTVGLDVDEIVAQVREELSADNGFERGAPARFEPGDPARVPGRGLAWFAVLAALLLIAGIYAFYRSYFAPGLGPAPLRDETEQPATGETEAQPAQPAQAAAQPTGGPVVFTNEMEGTWVRFYDAQDETLFEGIMAVGDTFAVPEGADTPQIRTGRPYAFAITVGGRSVPKISEVDEIVSDVPVSAEALLARPAPTATPSPTPPPTPAAQ